MNKADFEDTDTNGEVSSIVGNTPWKNPQTEVATIAPKESLPNKELLPGYEAWIELAKESQSAVDQFEAEYEGREMDQQALTELEDLKAYAKITKGIVADLETISKNVEQVGISTLDVPIPNLKGRNALSDNIPLTQNKQTTQNNEEKNTKDASPKGKPPASPTEIKAWNKLIADLSINDPSLNVELEWSDPGLSGVPGSLEYVLSHHTRWTRPLQPSKKEGEIDPVLMGPNGEKYAIGVELTTSTEYSVDQLNEKGFQAEGHVTRYVVLYKI